VAFVLNYDPTFPPEGSGLFGFVLADVFLKAEPFFPEAALAAINFLLLDFLAATLFDPTYFFGI
jgi:hypothetical protein